MIEKINLNNILFLDIETVPQEEHFNSLDNELKELWEQKTQYQRREDFTPEEFYDRAGIWAEFGKIICISVDYRHLHRQVLLPISHGQPTEQLCFCPLHDLTLFQ